MKHRHISFVFIFVLIVAIFGITPLEAPEQDLAHKEAFVGSWISMVPDSVDPVSWVTLHIKRAGGDSLTGIADAPDTGFFGIPFSNISVTEDGLNFALPSARFEGKLTADGLKIKGTFTEQGQSFPISFGPLTDTLAATLPKPPNEQRPKAEVLDVNSPKAIMEALYDVISGPADEGRNWDRFRSLFLPDARLIATTRLGGQPHSPIRN